MSISAKGSARPPMYDLFTGLADDKLHGTAYHPLIASLLDFSLSKDERQVKLVELQVGVG